jgi:antitoxin component YwqK of YwqJK toxin-antitoxin module
MLYDYDTYNSGKAKSESESYIFGKNMGVGHTSEYYESGRLKSEKWYESRRPVLQLEFYNSGQLKAEERYFNGEVTYGAYYKEDGGVEKIVGKRLREEVAKAY